MFIKWYKFLDQHGTSRDEEIEIIPALKDLQKAGIVYYLIDQKPGDMMVNTHSAPHWVFVPVSVVIFLIDCTYLHYIISLARWNYTVIQCRLFACFCCASLYGPFQQQALHSTGGNASNEAVCISRSGRC